MSSEYEKMLSGLLYSPNDPELASIAKKCRGTLLEYNTGRVGIEDLAKLFGRCGLELTIERPFHCDYGLQITMGARVYRNAGCVLLDCARIDIGDDVLMGPGVQLLTVGHPMDYETRKTGLEIAKPIVIGEGAWIGGGAIILPGVTIGARSVIGAGAIVTRNVEADVLAFGNPARVVRRL